MILSGQQILEYGIVEKSDNVNPQPNSIDLKLTGVYYPVTKEIGKKLSEEDFHEVDKFVIKDISAWRKRLAKSTNYYHLDYDTKYLFGVQKINLSPRLLPTTTIENDQLCATYEKKYFTAEIKPKSSWSRRGWMMSPNHFDSGFVGDGAVIIRTPQYQDGMPNKITVNTDMYFAQLVVSDAYPTENYNGQYQGSKF